MSAPYPSNAGDDPQAAQSGCGLVRASPLPVAAEEHVLREVMSSEQALDDALIKGFVRERCHSKHSQASYHASLRRLGWFCTKFLGLQSVRQLQRHHWEDYRAYLRSPPAEHIMAHQSFKYDSPGWAPFRGPLSERSATQSEVIAKVFYGWMADPAVSAIPFSPVSSIRTRSVRRSATAQGVDRFLPTQLWPFIQQALEQMPSGTLLERRRRARSKWVINLAVRTGLRASEMASALFGNLQPSATHPGRYSLNVTRKGGVLSSLPVLPEVVQAYRAYLAVYGELQSLDVASLPLILPLRLSKGQKRISATSSRYLWRIVKDVMQAAAQLAKEAGDEFAHSRLQQASTHWLRHTFASDLFDAGADVLSVRDLLDHASLTTTSRYLHKPEERLRQDLERLSRVGEPPDGEPDTTGHRARGV